MNITTTPSPTTLQEKTAFSSYNEVGTTIAACLSLFGTLVIFATFALWKDIRTPSRKILVYLSVGDFLTALANVFGLWIANAQGDSTACEVQGTVNIAAILSSFFWTVYLSLYLYLSIGRRISSRAERRVMFIFHITAWGIPLLIALLAYELGAVGSTRDYASDGWCWIDTHYGKKHVLLWMLVAGKGWEILAHVAIIVLYVLVNLHLRAGMHYQQGTPLLNPRAVEVAKKAERKFTFIPLVFIVLRIWGTIRFFLYAYHCLPLTSRPCDLKPHLWLIVLHGIGDSSQGFANFVLFCLFTEKIRNKFRCSKTDDSQVKFESTNVAVDFHSSGNWHI